MSKLFQIAMLLAASSTAGCMPIRPIAQTNKAADYTSQPQNIVLVPAIAFSLPPGQVDVFERELLASLQACGVKVTATSVISAMPTPDVIAAAARGNGGTTKADSVLALQTTQTGTSTSGQTSVAYGLSLDDLVSNRTVWKAVVNVHWDPLLSDHSGLGRDLAAATMAALRKDNLLPERCALAR